MLSPLHLDNKSAGHLYLSQKVVISRFITACKENVRNVRSCRSTLQKSEFSELLFWLFFHFLFNAQTSLSFFWEFVFIAAPADTFVFPQKSLMINLEILNISAAEISS